MSNQTSKQKMVDDLVSYEELLGWLVDVANDSEPYNSRMLMRCHRLISERLTDEMPARICSRCSGIVLDPDPNFCVHCAAAFGGRFHVKTGCSVSQDRFENDDGSPV